VPKATLFENLLKGHMKRAGIRFQAQFPVKYGKEWGTFTGRQRYLDFWLPGCRWAVEVDGGYHREIRQTLYDEARQELISRHIHPHRFVRLTNSQVAKGKNSPELTAFLAEAYDAQRLCDLVDFFVRDSFKKTRSR